MHAEMQTTKRPQSRIILLLKRTEGIRDFGSSRDKSPVMKRGTLQTQVYGHSCGTVWVQDPPQQSPKPLVRLRPPSGRCPCEAWPGGGHGTAEGLFHTIPLISVLPSHRQFGARVTAHTMQSFTKKSPYKDKSKRGLSGSASGAASPGPKGSHTTQEEFQLALGQNSSTSSQQQTAPR